MRAKECRSRLKAKTWIAEEEDEEGAAQTGWKDVGKKGEVCELCNRLFLIGKLQNIEISCKADTRGKRRRKEREREIKKK